MLSILIAGGSARVSLALGLAIWGDACEKVTRDTYGVNKLIRCTAFQLDLQLC